MFLLRSGLGSMAADKAVIALQIERRGNVKVSFRNLWLKNL